MVNIGSRGLTWLLLYLLVPNFLDIEKAAFGADVGFAQILDSVDDRSANSESNTVVIRFAYSS